MEVDTAPIDRHAALKRKATETINEILGAQKRCKKSQIQKLRDVESYKKIIQTYKAPIWYGCAVSPRDLADFGWRCVKKDCVQCVECEQYLSTTLPKICSVSYNTYNCSLKEVHEKMVTAHRSTCKLRSGAPAFRLSEPTAKEILTDIQDRLVKCKSVEATEIKTHIPLEVNLPKFDGVEQTFIYWGSLGWNISSPSRGKIVVGCDFCARELSLGMKSENDFDPVHNHERWCPVIEMNEDGEPSWLTDLNIVLNTKNRIGPRYADSAIYKEALAAHRLIDSSLSAVISPSIV